MIKEILEFNRNFVENKSYEKYLATKYPSRKIAVFSCMDTRLTELLPAAMGFKNGDIKLIKNAGAHISHPFGSVIRSLIIAIYDLGVEEVLVVGHHDCGVQVLDSEAIIGKMKKRGIPEQNFSIIKNCGIDLDHWLSEIECIEDSVRETVNTIKNHPLVPKDINVYGLIIDPTTGKLDPVVL